MVLFECLRSDIIFMLWKTSGHFLFDRDYHGLRVQLRAIRAKPPRQDDTSSSLRNAEVDHIHHPTPTNEDKYGDSKGGDNFVCWCGYWTWNNLFSTILEVNRGSTASASTTCSCASEINPTTNRNTDASGYGHVSPTKRKSNQEKSKCYMYDQRSIPTTHRISGTSASFRLRLSILPSYLTATTLNAPFQEALVDQKTHPSSTSSGICLHHSLQFYHNL